MAIRQNKFQIDLAKCFLDNRYRILRCYTIQNIYFYSLLCFGVGFLNHFLSILTGANVITLTKLTYYVTTLVEW